MFPPNLNSSCIEFDVMDDDIALEDPEEFTWTLLPPPTVPRVVISGNTTRVIIIDDDSESTWLLGKYCLYLDTKFDDVAFFSSDTQLGEG